MNLVIDGIIYKHQKHGGIRHIFSEILPRMCDLAPELNVITILQPDVLQMELPQHPQIHYQSIPEPGYYFRPYRLWKPTYPKLRMWGARLKAGISKDKIWLSTYYTTPALWRGQQVVVAYDFIHERYRNEHWQDDIRSADATIKSKATAIRNADLVICISESTRQDLLAFYPNVPADKTAVVHLSHSPTFQRLKSEVNQEKRFILFVGNRRRYKGFPLLLDVLSRFLENKEIELICVGGDWEETENVRIARLGLQSNIRLLKNVDDQQLCALYNQASIFVYPSEYEGFGIPLLEAMACGCKIVASRIPSTVEVAQDVPYYFSVGDGDELFKALEEAFNDTAAVERKERGILLAGQYSWDCTARKFFTLLERIKKL